MKEQKFRHCVLLHGFSFIPCHLATQDSGTGYLKKKNLGLFSFLYQFSPAKQFATLSLTDRIFFSAIESESVFWHFLSSRM